MNTRSTYFPFLVLFFAVTLFSVKSVHAQTKDYRNAAYIEYQLLIERYDGRIDIEYTILSALYERRIRILPFMQINLKTGLGLLINYDTPIFHLGTLALIGKNGHLIETGLGRYYGFEKGLDGWHPVGFRFEVIAGYRYESKKGWLLKVGLKGNVDGLFEGLFSVPYLGIGKAF